MLRALPLALFFLALVPAVAAQTASVSGTVRDAETGETLIQATVVAEGTGLGAATNREGFYVLTGLGAGEVALVVSYVGYEPFRTTLTLGPAERRRLDVALAPAAFEGGEVVVESEAPLEEEKAVGVQNVPIRLIQQIPSAIENDLFRALQLLPGVKAASDFSSRLYIRGGSPDQTLILLDQTTVYNPTHFFGFFSTFNTDAIKDVRVFKGGYPAEYGGRLGSVIDVSNRDGNRNALDGKLSVGLLASRVNAEGPYRLPKALGGAEGSWFLALRRSTLEPLLAALRDSEEFIPDGFYFLDFNGKATLDLSPNDRLSVAGYTGVDDVDFPFAENARFNLRYGNQTGSVNYTRIFSDRIFSTLRFTGSRYFSFPKAEVAGTEFEQRNTIDDVSVKADVEWLASPQFETKVGVWGGDLSLRLNNFFDGQETLDSRIESRYFSGYGQATVRPTPAWIVTAGLRAATFSSGDYLRLEPRLSVERKFGERVLAQAAYGRYYQFLTLVSNEAFSAFDVWVTAAEDVPPSYGDQFVLGLKTRPLDNFGADVEVYYRTLRDLFEIDPNLPDVAGLDYADIFRFGEGYATGVEFLLERPKGRRQRLRRVHPRAHAAQVHRRRRRPGEPRRQRRAAVLLPEVRPPPRPLARGEPRTRPGLDADRHVRLRHRAGLHPRHRPLRRGPPGRQRGGRRHRDLRAQPRPPPRLPPRRPRLHARGLVLRHRRLRAPAPDDQPLFAPQRVVHPHRPRRFGGGAGPGADAAAPPERLPHRSIFSALASAPLAPRSAMRRSPAVPRCSSSSSPSPDAI